MKLCFEQQAWDDLCDWASADKRVFKKVQSLLKDIARTPFDGIGKPEPLKHQLAGYWSRRIDGEHRLVYHVTHDSIIVAQCRGHY